MRLLAATSIAVGTGLITTVIITSNLSILAVTSGWGLYIGGALFSITIPLSLKNDTFWSWSQLFEVKLEKNNSIKLLLQAKLGSISDAVSKSIQNENISTAQPHKILQEMEKYHKLIEEIRKQNKVKFKEITKKQEKWLLEQRRKVGKENFFQKF